MLYALVFCSLAVAQSVTSADTIRLSPAVIGEFELGKNGVNGSRVRQLAWSPDGKELYLMTYEPKPDASIKQAFHYVIAMPGGRPNRVDAPPAWAAAYWTWKSDRSAPGEPSLTIELSEEKKRAETGVALPTGGDMARGGTADPATGLSSESALNAARGMENNDVRTMRLKGEIIGEWINLPIVPGLTFGWGPKESGLIAFADKSTGKLVIMDKTGKKQKVADTKAVILPAWSEDGARIAYLEGRGRSKFAVVVADVDVKR
jgi:hypothetical protein